MSERPAPADATQDGVVLLHGISRTARSFRKMQPALERCRIRHPQPGLCEPPQGAGGAGGGHSSRHPALCRSHRRLRSFRLPFHGRAAGARLPRQASAETPGPRRDARHAEQRQRNRRSAEEFWRLSRLLRTRRTAARHTAGRCDQALLPPVDYPVGIIAGNRSIDPVAGTMLPKPHDGRVSVENTKIDGMADHVMVATSHPWLVRNSVAIAQTIAFLRDGRFSVAAIR